MKTDTAKLNIQNVKLSDAKPHPQNPRILPKNNSKEYNLLKKSLKKGYNESLVFNSRNNCWVSGHLRAQILKDEFGYEFAEAHVVDLSENDHIAMMIRLNKHDGLWDIAALREILSDLDDGSMDMDITGFSLEELEKTLLGDEEKGENEKKKQKCPKCGSEI